MPLTAIEISPDRTIPLSRVRFRFVRSSGPGGQNVNKVATKVELYFDVLSCPELTGEEKERILRKLGRLVDASGVLRIVEQSARTQLANRAAAAEKLGRLLHEALKRPKHRRKTSPGTGAREARLLEKKKRSEKLRNRRWKAEGE